MSARGVCPCGVHLVAYRRWQQMTREQRREARSRGVNAHYARGLCCACYERSRLSPDRPDRVTYARDEVLTEWRMFYDPTRSIAANCRTLAPRMGMSYAALERAITRARVEGAAA